MPCCGKPIKMRHNNPNCKKIALAQCATNPKSMCRLEGKRIKVAVRVSSTCLTLAQGLFQSVGSHILLALGGHGLLADLPVARGGRHRGSLHAVRTTGNQRPHSLTTGVRHLGAEFSTFPTHSDSALGALEANPTGHRGLTDTPEYLHRLPKHHPQWVIF